MTVNSKLHSKLRDQGIGVLTTWIPLDMHKKLKAKAANEGKTIREVMHDLVKSYISNKK